MGPLFSLPTQVVWTGVYIYKGYKYCQTRLVKANLSPNYISVTRGGEQGKDLQDNEETAVDVGLPEQGGPVAVPSLKLFPGLRRHSTDLDRLYRQLYFSSSSASSTSGIAQDLPHFCLQ